MEAFRPGYRKAQHDFMEKRTAFRNRKTARQMQMEKGEEIALEWAQPREAGASCLAMCKLSVHPLGICSRLFGSGSRQQSTSLRGTTNSLFLDCIYPREGFRVYRGVRFGGFTNGFRKGFGFRGSGCLGVFGCLGFKV